MVGPGQTVSFKVDADGLNPLCEVEPLHIANSPGREGPFRLLLGGFPQIKGQIGLQVPLGPPPLPIPVVQGLCCSTCCGTLKIAGLCLLLDQSLLVAMVFP